MSDLDKQHVLNIVERARDTMTVGRVYGDPVERDGTLVIPAVAVMGGGGGGSGVQGAQSGAGGGFGLRARPVGAFVIQNGDVRWEPVVDRERQAVIGAAVATVVLLTLRSALRGRRRRR